MKKTKQVEFNFIDKIAKKLAVGDRLQSKTGKVLTVTLVLPKENRVIVLFDGDMEIDFDPYHRLQVVDSMKLSVDNSDKE